MLQCPLWIPHANGSHGVTHIESSTRLLLFFNFCCFFFFLTCIHCFIYLFLAALDLHCWTRTFSSCRELGPLSSCGSWAPYCGGFSCWGAQDLGCTGFSSRRVHRLQERTSCSLWTPEHAGFSSCGTQAYLLQVWGIFPDQGSDPYPLHRQADSYLLRYQGSPCRAAWSGLLRPPPEFRTELGRTESDTTEVT